MFQWLKRGCAWDAGFSWFSTILFFPMVKFLNFKIKNLLSSIWNYCLHLAEVKKRQILIKFWTGMIYGKIYDYFPMPNYSWTNGIFLWIFTCKNYFCTWQNFSKFGKNPKNLPSRHTQTIKSYVHLWITTISLSTKFATAMFKTAEQPTGKSGRNRGQQRGVAHRYFQGY